MATIQSDIFGWHTSCTLELVHERNEPPTVEVLSDALIKFFGEWVGKTLLGDDWTVKETLCTIHKVFTREQLQSVESKTWKNAWERFEQHYLTKRPTKPYLSF